MSACHDSRRRLRCAVLDFAEEIAVDCRTSSDLRQLAADVRHDAREVSDDIRAMPRAILLSIAGELDAAADRLVNASMLQRIARGELPEAAL